MDISKQKEQFGLAYVRAVAAVAGYGATIPAVDDDSVDLILSDKGAEGSIRSPRLEIQHKSTSRHELLHDDHIAFPLPIKNYEELRPTNFLVPRILIVTLLPEALGDWLAQTNEELVLRRSSYWVSLRGRGAVENEASVTVHVPLLQQFTVGALQAVMATIQGGGAP